MNDTFDFIALGDTTQDTFWSLETNEAKIVCSVNRENCQLCFNYADKIPVDHYHECLGGNSANAAVTAARMGLNTAIWTVMGEDDIGKRAKRYFEKEGIATDFFEYDSSIHSKVSNVINYLGERTILIYGDPIHYKLPNLPKARWAYLSSIGRIRDGLYQDITNWVFDNSVKLVYQPGTFQIRMGSEPVKEMLKNTYIIVMNKEEATDYVGNSKLQETNSNQIPNSNIQISKLLQGLLDLGPKIALITDGKEGAFASDGKKVYKQGIRDIPVVEKTGAGDAYASAFAIALFKGKSMEEAMMWGLLNSEAVISKIGPQAGILTLEEIEKKAQELESNTK